MSISVNALEPSSARDLIPTIRSSVRTAVKGNIWGKYVYKGVFTIVVECMGLDFQKGWENVSVAMAGLASIMQKKLNK